MSKKAFLAVIETPLGVWESTAISDAIYCDRHTVADFYAALSNEGFTIDAAPPASVEKEDGR